MSRYDIKINKKWQQTLINHFIRCGLGKEYLNKEVEKYSEKEYREVIDKLFSRRTANFIDLTENAHQMYPYEKDILLSYLNFYLPKVLNKSETVTIKNYLSHQIVSTAFLRLDSPEEIYRRNT